MSVSVAAGLFEPDALSFFGPVFVAAALHPVRGELLVLRDFDRDSIDPVLLGPVGPAVVPVALYVAGQLTVQSALADEHAELGHYATMAYFGVIPSDVRP